VAFKSITDLKAFEDELGDCVVPRNRAQYPKQKQSKQPSHMTEVRAGALNEIGYCRDTHKDVWGERQRE
jgi:hypothetical protein